MKVLAGPLRIAIGILIGAVLGFAFGTQFDLRGYVNWIALGVFSSLAVVVVALIPIGLEYRRRLLLTRSTRDHVMSLLILIEDLLKLALTAHRGPLSDAEAAPIHELFALIPQLDLLEESEARHVITAVGRARMLILAKANPQPGAHKPDFEEALSKI